jgi:DNA-binding response OmpR family regulator
MAGWLKGATGQADDDPVKGRADRIAHAGSHTRPCVVWASGDLALRDEVTQILADDFDVIDVPDGAKALQAVREHLPELVLSDVVMPHVDGLALLAALRAHPQTCSMPVLFVVDPGAAVRPAEGIALAADDYVVKPLVGPDLVARVHTHIALYHTQRAWAIERERAAQEMARTDWADRERIEFDVPELAEVGQRELRREPLELTVIAQGIVADLRARDPGRVVEVRVSDGMTATGDCELMTIALEHLLGNAWKFTRQRAHAEIVMECQHDGVFVVRDNGAGFDMAHSVRLFRPFQRLHPGADFDGAGLGLAIVSRIIERHGGEVWAYGIVNGGASVWFTLGRGADPEPLAPP